MTAPCFFANHEPMIHFANVSLEERVIKVFFNTLRMSSITLTTSALSTSKSPNPENEYRSSRG